MRNQLLQATLPEKEEQLRAFTDKSRALSVEEKEIDSFVDIGHQLVQTCEAEQVKPIVSQIGARYTSKL